MKQQNCFIIDNLWCCDKDRIDKQKIKKMGTVKNNIKIEQTILLLERNILQYIYKDVDGIKR